jgi:hypothetical protein
MHSTDHGGVRTFSCPRPVCFPRVRFHAQHMIIPSSSVGRASLRTLTRCNWSKTLAGFSGLLEVVWLESCFKPRHYLEAHLPGDDVLATGFSARLEIKPP